jgi:hypothetical protein
MANFRSSIGQTISHYLRKAEAATWRVARGPIARACCLLALGFVTTAAAQQEPKVIPLASEPHHRLALHNHYVNVYQVEVAPHDSVLLHRHDVDAISLMMSESLVTVHAPGKPDVQQKLANGQVRLQARGYVHSTSIDGDNTYRNVTVELLLPQQGARNFCAQVVPGQPLNCAEGQGGAARLDQPQFETDQTRVTMIRVPPHESVKLGEADREGLIVVLDDGVVRVEGELAEKTLPASGFVWLERGKAGQIFKNNGEKEARLVSFALKP